MMYHTSAPQLSLHSLHLCLWVYVPCSPLTDVRWDVGKKDKERERETDRQIDTNKVIEQNPLGDGLLLTESQWSSK